MADLDKKVTFIELGEHAEGTIEARPDQLERLDEFTERVGSGEFHKEIAVDIRIPVRCVDGRNDGSMEHPLAPNAAGATETIVVADDLTTQRFGGTSGTTLESYENAIEMLKNADQEVGGHTDAHADDSKSGCGANDKLAAIYDFINRKGAVLREVAGALSLVDVSDSTHSLITGKAASRAQFSKGSELFDMLKKHAKAEYIDQLDGEHNEVVAVINKRYGTTLDRRALLEVFGPNYEAFNVDAWSFEEAARLTSTTEDEMQQKIAAMTYYNLATTMVLGGKKLRIVVLE